MTTAARYPSPFGRLSSCLWRKMMILRQLSILGQTYIKRPDFHEDFPLECACFTWSARTQLWHRLGPELFVLSGLCSGRGVLRIRQHQAGSGQGRHPMREPLWQQRREHARVIVRSAIAGVAIALPLRMQGVRSSSLLGSIHHAQSVTALFTWKIQPKGRT